jgi:shikimate kinase
VTGHLAGSGPSFFALIDDDSARDEVARAIAALGFDARVATALQRDAALTVEEL